MKTLILIPVLLCLGCLGEDNQEPVGFGGDGRERAINGPASCSDCEVVLKEVARLGGPDDPGSIRGDAISRECMVSQLSTGEYLVSGIVGGGEIFVYGPSGDLQRTIGQRGEGPGEFGGQTRLVVGPGDTLYVIDDQYARLQVLLPSGDYIRSFTLPGNIKRFTLLGDGNLLFFRELWQPEDAPLYLLSPSGEELATFGKATLDEWDAEFWILSPSVSGGFWASSRWTYELNLWSGPESVEKTLIREVGWFPPFQGFPEDMYGTAPPVPALIHLWEDDSGLLWAYSVVPDPEWKPDQGRRPNPEWYLRTFDTIIEVIDVESASLVAQGRHERRVARVCGSNLMYAVLETEEGDTRVQVLEPTLARPDEG